MEHVEALYGLSKKLDQELSDLRTTLARVADIRLRGSRSVADDLARNGYSEPDAIRIVTNMREEMTAIDDLLGRAKVESEMLVDYADDSIGLRGRLV